MANLNKVHLIGNLTRDPECKYTPKGTAVGDFGIAVNRRVKDGNDNWSDEVTFIDITVWGQQAEFAQKYLTKGSGAFIEGRLQLDTWEDKASGQKRSKLKVVAESVQGLGKKEGGGEPSAPRNPMGGTDRTAAEAMKKPAVTQPDDEEDSIPF